MKTITLATIATFCAATCSAATFTDRAIFLAQHGTFTEHSSVVGGFDISAEPGSATIIATGTYTDKFDPNDFVILSGLENFNIAVTFASQIFAFGMDIYEPTSTAVFNGCNVNPCTESTFEISFLSGASLLETIAISPANDVLDFIGYTSTSSFDRIEVRETVGSNDNEMFGNFVTSTTPVPLPAALPLLGASVAIIGIMGRRKRAST